MSKYSNLVSKRVKCIYMNDPRPVPEGTEGTVKHIDSLNQIHVKWDNGSTLALIPETDKWEILNNE